MLPILLKEKYYGAYIWPYDPDIEKTKVYGFQHKFVGVYFTLEAKNNACKISASKLIFLVELVLVELSFGRVVFCSRSLLV
jgi:hypothetical protein